MGNLLSVVVASSEILNLFKSISCLRYSSLLHLNNTALCCLILSTYFAQVIEEICMDLLFGIILFCVIIIRIPNTNIYIFIYPSLTPQPHHIIILFYRFIFIFIFIFIRRMDNIRSSSSFDIINLSLYNITTNYAFDDGFDPILLLPCHTHVPCHAFSSITSIIMVSKKIGITILVIIHMIYCMSIFFNSYLFLFCFPCIINYLIYPYCTVLKRLCDVSYYSIWVERNRREGRGVRG